MHLRPVSIGCGGKVGVEAGRATRDVDESRTDAVGDASCALALGADKAA